MAARLCLSAFVVALDPTAASVVAASNEPECQPGVPARGGDEEMELFQRQTLARVGADRADRQPASDREMRSQVRGLGEGCGRGVYASATSSGECPADCPLFVRDLSPQAPADGPETHCTFACVPATEMACTAYSPLEPIPDADLGVCRGCQIRGCEACVEPSAELSAQEMDRCVRCGPAYTLQADGTCLSSYRYFWYALFAVIALWSLVVLAWLVDLTTRPITNTAGLEHGLSTRSRAKLHTPKMLEDADLSEDSRAGSCASTPAPTPRGRQSSGRTLWPLSTNLCRTDVAGPGLVLHFNYLAMLTLWSTVITVGWAVFAYVTDPSFFMLGLSWADTPREACAVIAWGHDTQSRLMWAKVVFVAFCYVWSVALFLWFGAYQLRLFQRVEGKATTHMDFAVIMKNLPAFSGNEQVEDILAGEIERATGEKPVGVSLTWEMADLREDLMRVIDDQLDELHEEHNKQEARMMGGTVSMAPGTDRMILTPRTGRLVENQSNALRRLLIWVESVVLSRLTQQLANRSRRHDSSRRHGSGSLRSVTSSKRNLNSDKFLSNGSSSNLGGDNVEQELRMMHSCNTAFAVFNTQQARDKVVAVCKRSGGFCFRGKAVKVRKAFDEPDSVNWTNFHDTHWFWMTGRCIMGVMMAIGALLAWMMVFYVPYAIFFLKFNYGSGQWPGKLEEMSFTLIIVSGNAAMYHVCSSIADWVSFRHSDDRELCYMLLYFFSCLLMVALHFLLDYKVAYMALVGVGSRTHDGVPLADLSSFNDKFESYPMQRELGWTIFCYACPCTFILPFVAEYFGTIIMPYKIMTTIVGSQRGITGSQADFFLAAPSMNLSRYADVTLNCVLGTLVFFFPSGLNFAMFGMLTFSNIMIFSYDHYRVLRTVPAFQMSTNRTDVWAQSLLAIPCGLLLACAAFKANCVEGFERFHPPGPLGHCKEGEAVVMKCFLVLFLHVFFHIVVLRFIIPFFGDSEEEVVTTTYAECAQRLAHSWFSVNPVHCLRSKYIYKHSPPWVYSRIGNEHLLPVNPMIGAYFSDSSVKCEDFRSTLHMAETLKLASEEFTARRSFSRWSLPRLSVSMAADTE